MASPWHSLIILTIMATESQAQAFQETGRSCKALSSPAPGVTLLLPSHSAGDLGPA